MFSCQLEPPCDNLYQIEAIMIQVFEEFIKKGYNYRFRDIYDLVHEEIENNFDKYQVEPDYGYND